jgi:hypothetical protein
MSDREGMTDWKKFALLIFAIGALVAVVVVYMAIKGDLARML